MSLSNRRLNKQDWSEDIELALENERNKKQKIAKKQAALQKRAQDEEDRETQIFAEILLEHQEEQSKLAEQDKLFDNQTDESQSENIFYDAYNFHQEPDLADLAFDVYLLGVAQKKLDKKFQHLQTAQQELQHINKIKRLVELSIQCRIELSKGYESVLSTEQISGFQQQCYNVDVALSREIEIYQQQYTVAQLVVEADPLYQQRMQNLNLKMKIKSESQEIYKQQEQEIRREHQEDKAKNSTKRMLSLLNYTHDHTAKNKTGQVQLGQKDWHKKSAGSHFMSRNNLKHQLVQEELFAEGLIKNQTIKAKELLDMNERANYFSTPKQRHR